VRDRANELNLSPGLQSKRRDLSASHRIYGDCRLLRVGAYRDVCADMSNNISFRGDWINRRSHAHAAFQITVPAHHPTSAPLTPQMCS
jgi:hypothetical protein